MVGRSEQHFGSLCRGCLCSKHRAEGNLTWLLGEKERKEGEPTCAAGRAEIEILGE